MRTVPAAWAAIALFDDDDGLRAARQCQVLVGERAEVDIDALASLDRSWAQRLAQVASRIGSGDEVWQVPVRLGVQRSGGAGKKDLTGELEELSGNAATSLVCEQLLAPSVDAAALQAACVAADGHLEVGADEVSVVLDLAPEGLGECLGGPAWPGEWRRRVRIVAKHAPWRDRQVRRLARVECFSLIRVGGSST